MKAYGTLVVLRAFMFLFGCCCCFTETRDDLRALPCSDSQVQDGTSLGVSVQATNMDNVYGVLSCVVAVFLYGSNFVPVKKVDTGDGFQWLLTIHDVCQEEYNILLLSYTGMFFQWTCCAAIWVVSLFGDVLLCSSKAHLATMLGGMIWATGNISSVLVIKCIGLGLGMLLWGASSLLMGWVSSRFGLFGLEPDEVSKPVLDYCGAGLCLVSVFLFFLVKSDVQKPSSPDTTPILIEVRSFSDCPRPSDSWVDTLSPKAKRPLGCLIGVLSGLLCGASFIPMLYIKHHAKSNTSVFTGASQNDLDYCFAHCSGIFLTSTVYFVIYCAAMRNRPRVYPRAILPGFLTGMMWGIATYCWLMANRQLGPVITFPIVTAGYGLVAALWGSVVFKEVKGLANGLLFFLASVVVLTGSIVMLLSKI